jgi:serine/threonine protein kinase
MPFQEDGMICLPMEYVDGQSLADRSKRQLPESEALEYMRQMGQALVVVHGQKLVHRDIRPANILRRVGEITELVLADFGLAVDCETELSRARTQERMDGFSPLELYTNHWPIDVYTDVYSLAATLYELLTGEVPASAEERQLQRRSLASPRRKNPDISRKTARAIVEGMELLPENRPQSVEDWLALLDIELEPDIPPHQPNHRSKSGVNWTKWGVIWTAVGVVVALLVGLLGWFVPYQSPPEPQPTPTPTSEP